MRTFTVGLMASSLVERVNAMETDGWAVRQIIPFEGQDVVVVFEREVESE